MDRFEKSKSSSHDAFPLSPPLFNQGPPPLPDRRGAQSAMRAYSPAPSLYSPTYDRPPPPLPAPGYERPPPLGANSRAESKLSLDMDNCSDKETTF